jgi:hypothetical protein
MQHLVSTRKQSRSSHSQIVNRGALLCCACAAAVLFGDVGKKAAGRKGRTIVYCIIYSLDATRCVILHLAATQSLQHALGDAAPPMWQCGLAVLVAAGIFTQVCGHVDSAYCVAGLL